MPQGIPWWAHRDNDGQRANQFLALLSNPIGSKDPDALKNPRPQVKTPGAPIVTENATLQAVLANQFQFFGRMRYILRMLGKSTMSRTRSRWRILLGVLCVSLIMLGGVVSATHTHSQGEISHQDCGLCVTAHMAIQVAVSVTHVCVAQVFTRVESSQPVARTQFIPQFALFSRPPPACLDRS